MKPSAFLAAVAAILHARDAALGRLERRTVAERGIRATEQRKIASGHSAASRDDLRACPDLAYGLHRQGGKCRRMGGNRVCQQCLADLRPEEAARCTTQEYLGP